MRLIERFTNYVKADMWRPGEHRVLVRKRRPGLGWTINLAAVPQRLRRS